MSEETSFRRVAAISAIVSGPVALASWVLASLAVEFNFDVASDPANIITLGPRGGELFGPAWIQLLPPFGACSPLSLVLAQTASANLVTLHTLFGFAYILTGAVAVTLLGGAGPPMMRAYAEASGSEREMLMVVFRAVIDVAFFGVGALAYLLGALWWLGTGVALRNEGAFWGRSRSSWGS